MMQKKSRSANTKFSINLRQLHAVASSSSRDLHVKYSIKWLQSAGPRMLARRSELLERGEVSAPKNITFNFLILVNFFPVEIYWKVSKTPRCKSLNWLKL